MGIRDLPIRQKLMLISMVASAAAILLSCAVFMVLDYQRFRDSLVRDIGAMAELIASNSAAALVSGSRGAVEVTLQALAAEANIVSARVYQGGELFAEYVRDRADAGPGTPPPGDAAPRYAEGILHVRRPIAAPDGRALGFVYLRSDTSGVHARLRQQALITLGVICGAVILAYALTRRLQRIVVQPVAELSRVAAAVAAGRDYSLRALKDGDDELGALIDRFNDMLDQIEARGRELRAAHRAAEQHAEQLASRNRDLEEALQARDLFFANMSHDLRTPLNAIIGFTGALLMQLPGPLNAQQQEQLGIVRESADRLLAMISDLLDLANIASGRVELVPETLSSRELAEQAASTMRAAARRKNLEVCVRVPEADVSFVSDRRAVRHILANFCRNAVKYTESGSVTVAVAPVRMDGAAAVEFTVEDTGPGIQPEHRDKLFDAFARIDTTGRDGAGMGLHLSKKLAQLVHGHIRFASDQGRGTHFWLTVPTQWPAAMEPTP